MLQFHSPLNVFHKRLSNKKGYPKSKPKYCICVYESINAVRTNVVCALFAFENNFQEIFMRFITKNKQWLGPKKSYGSLLSHTDTAYIHRPC